MMINTFSIRFLQAVIVLIAVVALAILIGFPLMGGRATEDIFQIYLDPFILYVILYGYVASIPFFIALYQAFNLLGYIGQHKVFSTHSVRTLKWIKYCALVLSMFIVVAALYIRIFHHEDDDPAGFLALCGLTAFVCIVVATVAALFEKILQSAVDMKSENDLTI